MKLYEVYTQRIDEAFPIDYQQQSSEGWYGSFNTPDDTIEFEAVPLARGHYHITFTGREGYSASGDSAAPQEAMSTVFEFIEELVLAEHPEKITFSAAKKEVDKKTGQYYQSARGRLYTRKANQMAKKLGYDVEVRSNHPEEYNFIITKGEGKPAELPPKPSDRQERKRDQDSVSGDDTTSDDVDDIFSRLGF